MTVTRRRRSQGRPPPSRRGPSNHAGGLGCESHGSASSEGGHSPTSRPLPRPRRASESAIRTSRVRRIPRPAPLQSRSGTEGARAPREPDRSYLSSIATPSWSGRSCMPRFSVLRKRSASSPPRRRRCRCLEIDGGRESELRGRSLRMSRTQLKVGGPEPGRGLDRLRREGCSVRVESRDRVEPS